MQVQQLPANLDDAPPLIPIQPVEHNNVVNDEGLIMPQGQIIQIANPNAEEPPVANEQILAMDDDTDTDSDLHPQAQLPIPSVEIVDFPDLNNLQPLMPEEFLEGELMGWINEGGNELERNHLENQDNGLEIPQVAQQHLNDVDQLEQNQLMQQPQQVEQAPLPNHFNPDQIKEILELNAGSTSSSSPSPMAIRCWAKFFANMDANLPTVTIPAEWVNFFTLLMLKQGSYD
jgi:hypothetical protein